MARRTVEPFYGSLGQVMTAPPAVVELPSGQLQVFIRGADCDLHTRRQTSPVVGWSDWQQVTNGTYSAAPAVFINGPGTPRGVCIRDHGWVRQLVWRRVDSSFVGVWPEQHALAQLDRLVGAVGQRYVSDVGHRAVLLPVGVIAAICQLPPVLSVQSAEGGGVLFIDPAGGAAAGGLLRGLQDWPGSVWVALPDGSEANGLVSTGERLRLTTGAAPAEYELYLPGSPELPSADMLSAGPKLEEGPDVLRQRSAWFEKRSGGS